MVHRDESENEGAGLSSFGTRAPASFVRAISQEVKIHNRENNTLGTDNIFDPATRRVELPIFF